MFIESLVIAGLVFGLSVWMTGRLSSASSRVRLLDHPNERSLHDRPVPRTGGLAILCGIALGLALEVSLSLLGRGFNLLETRTSVWVIAMILLLALVSLWNDRVDLTPGLRFVVHGLAAAGIVLGAGQSIDSISIPFMGARPLGLAAIPFTIICLMWMTNLYNFMDGMDGFAGGMTVLGFGFLCVLGLGSGQTFISLMSLLSVAVAAGFLLYNWPPARIFMGDVGSILLGFLAGTLSIIGIHEGRFDVWVPVLIFSPFIVDATVTLFRRLLRGEKVWRAHREHYYQRMVLSGWTHRKTVLVEYCLMIACGLSAILYTRAQQSVRLTLIIVWAVIYGALALGVRAFERSGKVMAMREETQL
ncbi:MAG TPA: glycosyltransferase family 4 protein [Pyrinomonadaceae bacterium]|jgi:UDP-N-acetylmuramyl pentapeptide phosphotransferase/UDP-N-acetylglucosamine-1-phosphate transferase